jgi:flagellar basal body rod protein FlgC
MSKQQKAAAEATRVRFTKTLHEKGRKLHANHDYTMPTAEAMGYVTQGNAIIVDEKGNPAEGAKSAAETQQSGEPGDAPAKKPGKVPVS